jgi:hypothetical protein
VWAPYLELYADTDDELRLPAGVYLYGAGLLSRTSWDSVLALDAYAAQPRVQLSASYAPGPLTLGYAFDYSYRPTGDEAYRATITNEVSADSLRWHRRWPAASSGLSTRAALVLESERTSADAFTADGLFSETQARRELDLVGGVTLAHAAFAPAGAYFGGFGTRGTLEVRYTPPALDADGQRVETAFGADLRLPSGLSHQLLRLRLDGASSTEGSVAGLLRPTSGADWESGDGDVKLLGGLDYRIPLGLYDRPLPGPRPYRPALLGLGATLYAESAVYIDAASGSLEAEEDLFFGVEAEGRFSVLRLPLAGGVGAALRVDRSFGEPVGSDDWRVYVFLSSDPTTEISDAGGVRRRGGPGRGTPGRDAPRRGGAGLPDGLVPAGNAVR